MLDQIRDDSSSLFCLRDSASFRSSLTAATERSNLLDISFDFDRDLTATRVYHRQWRSLIRETVRSGRKAKGISAKSQNEHSNRLVSNWTSKVNNRPQVVDIRILVLAQPGSGEGALQEVMRTLCEGHFDPEICRGHIYQVLLTTINATLDKLAETSQTLEVLETKTRHVAILCQQFLTSGTKISEELGHRLVALWDDPGMKRCYQHNVEGISHPSAT